MKYENNESILFMPQFTLKNRIIKGAAFDMDGTLLDCSASRHAIQEVVGSDFYIDWSQCGGRGVPFIHDWLSAKYTNFAMTMDTFLEQCHHAHIEALHQLSSRHGMIELLDTLRDIGIPMAVVTNTETEMAKKRLDQCGVLDYMDIVIGSTTLTEQGLKLKPSPDGYQLAAKSLQINENEMIGFEDSVAGMTALDATDFMTVHIYDETVSPMAHADFQIDARTNKDMLQLIENIKAGR